MNDPIPPCAFDRALDSSSRPMLRHLALLAVRGADARSFLDNQLTRNVPVMDAGQSPSRASIAGYCSPKGRLLATFVVWSESSSDQSRDASSGGETIYMLTSRDIAEMVAKRLRMYVLRAKVTIEDVTAAHAIEVFHQRPSLADDAGLVDVWTIRSDGDARWIRYPDGGADADGRERFMRIGARSSNAPDAPVPEETWRWSEIRAGLPRITATTQDRFVPQMVNLEALGGVDFKKGCFPGQEVVARSQYLGKLKRRMTPASIALPDHDDIIAQPGSDVWSTDDDGPVGLVVNAERGPDGRVWLLVEIPLALFDSSALRVGRSDGPALKIESLPYPLPDNEVFVRPRL